MQHASSQRPSRLADHEVMPQLASLVEHDRTTTAEMLVLIGRAEARRLYAPTEYPSLFRYCVGKLRMSEDMAWKRIQAARAARKFPAIFAMLADGRLHLTAVVRLAPCLTRDNARELLAAAAHLPKQALKELLAARFPQPDFAEQVIALGTPVPLPASARVVGPTRSGPAVPAAVRVPEPAASTSSCPTGTSESQLVPEPVAPPASVAVPDLPARVTPLAPGRFGVQFTIGQAAHDSLRYAQALASHAVPGGALEEIFERALEAYVAKLEKDRFAATSRPRTTTTHRSLDTRHVPAAVAREVWRRDEGRCTFVSEEGQRCEACEFVEFDHVIPVAKGGESTVDNVRLRCRTHNQYEAEREFGAGFMEHKRAESRRRAEQKRAEARAKAAERARSEAYAQALEANAAARARALEALPWLCDLGAPVGGTPHATTEPAPRRGDGCSQPAAPTACVSVQERHSRAADLRSRPHAHEIQPRRDATGRVEHGRMAARTERAQVSHREPTSGRVEQLHGDVSGLRQRESDRHGASA